jgi:hypothetical protein
MSLFIGVASGVFSLSFALAELSWRGGIGGMAGGILDMATAPSEVSPGPQVRPQQFRPEQIAKLMVAFRPPTFDSSGKPHPLQKRFPEREFLTSEQPDITAVLEWWNGVQWEQGRRDDYTRPWVGKISMEDREHQLHDFSLVDGGIIHEDRVWPADVDRLAKIVKELELKRK